MNPTPRTHAPTTFLYVSIPLRLRARSLSTKCIALLVGLSILTAHGGVVDGSTLSAAALAVTPTTVFSTGVKWRGVNLSGAEFGSSEETGGYGSKYIYPSAASVNYFKDKGMNLVRLPFKWERLQPTLSKPFDSAELTRLKAFVNTVTAGGTSVLLDPHNSARWHGNIIGSSAVPVAAFKDFWQRLATEFKSNPNVLFGLTNEPNGMATETWVVAANAGIVAIRATGATNAITVPGNGYSGAHSWSSTWYGTANAKAMLQVTDSGNNLLIEAHQYLDSDSSGTSPNCVSGTVGVERLVNFTAWLKTNGKRALLGEFAGGNNETCRVAVSAMLKYMNEHSDQWAGWTWWAAGPWWGDYMYNLEPQGSTDRAQMAWLVPYLSNSSKNSSAASLYLLLDY